MKILITGICGFAGSAVAREWLEADQGLTLFGLDNLMRAGSETNRIALRKLGVTLYHGDIRMMSDFDDLPAVDWVIDASANPRVLAGIDGRTSSRQLVEHNLLGTINILEYCKRHQAGFILLSTSRVYSITPLAEMAVEPVGNAFHPLPGTNMPPGLSAAGVAETFSTAPPISLYGSTKLASEVLALEYGETYDFPVWVNRCGILAGAGQFGTADQGIFSFWINSWLRGRPLTYTGFGGKGYQVRDCLHPRDLVSLLRKQTGVVSGNAARLVNIGGGKDNAMSLAELSSWCEDRFGPRPVNGDPAMRRFDIPWLIMDSTLADEVWGWRPEVSIHEILREIAEHAERHPEWLQLSGAL